VRPLEIWDVHTSAGPLHACRHRPDYPRLLVEALGGTVEACGAEAIFVAGGGLLEPSIRDTLQARLAGRLGLLFAPDPVFAAGPGGKDVLQRLGKGGLIVDVGQTAIKVIHGQAQRLHPRDWHALPPAAWVRPEQREQQRRKLRDFVSSALRAHARPRPEAIVLGLPCDFPESAPGACSYAGLEGDRHFVAAILEQAGLTDAHCVYLNDAVLAALSARALCGRVLPRKTLVATLGFGVGGAVLGGPDDAL
jgi:hypothetical protein